MTSPVSTYGRVLGLGAVTGVRGSYGPALVSYAASRGHVQGLEGTRLGLLASRPISNLLTVLALGELAVDKLPFLPGRNKAPLIAGRALTGALTGSALSLSARRPVWTGAALGALSASAASVGAYHLRTAAIGKLGIPNPVAGLVEDIAVVAAGLRLVRG